MATFVVITKNPPWIHGIPEQDGIRDPNRTICGIDRSIPSEFWQSKVSFLDVVESQLDNKVCGICWWRYSHGNN